MNDSNNIWLGAIIVVLILLLMGELSPSPLKAWRDKAYGVPFYRRILLLAGSLLSVYFAFGMCIIPTIVIWTLLTLNLPTACLTIVALCFTWKILLHHYRVFGNIVLSTLISPLKWIITWSVRRS